MGVGDSAATATTAASGDEHRGGEVEEKERLSMENAGAAPFAAHTKVMAALRCPLQPTSHE